MTEALPPRKRRQALELLSRPRLAELTEHFELEVEDRRVHAEHVDALIRSRLVEFADILPLLYRDELKAMCEELGFDSSGREKQPLVDRLLLRRKRKAASGKRKPEVQEVSRAAAPAVRSAHPAPKAKGEMAMSPSTTTEDPPPAPVSGPPTTRRVLTVLTKPRLAHLARTFSVQVLPRWSKDEQLDALLDGARLPFDTLLNWMSRDELKAACRLHGLEDSGRARAILAGRIMEARPDGGTVPPKRIFDPAKSLQGVPKRGSIVHVRHRQYLVEEVVPPPDEGHATLVKMVCLDDDAQGRPLDVLWELELGARIADEERLSDPERFDSPRHFGAYLHAIKWNCVTATDARLFQAPFRAGIKLMHHQMTPLLKALSLPRANLFIADDVGLGKTIEAGLIVQELEIRQRVDFVLIVCPASISLQWRDEMERRFGQSFVLFNRQFIARRRRERGFAVNPWATHNRFIISYQTLRRPEYQDPLLQYLRESGSLRLPKSLLIMDEAHTVAPATSTRIAVDSRQTHMARALAQHFENRLFLSATPHNGHSNSFSALLEILDPQRFTRGVKVRGSRQLDPVMVRRLKGDLRDLGVSEFPVRRVVQLSLQDRGGKWNAAYYGRVLEEGSKTDTHMRDASVGDVRTAEVKLSALLQKYAMLMRPQKGTGQLVFINLQKRLLSSIESFHRTLQLHAKSVASGKAKTALQLHLADADEDEYGADDETLDSAADSETISSSSALDNPQGKARELLDEMLALSSQQRTAPDGKVLALVEWVQRNLCPAVAIGGAGAGSKAWSDRRVLIFTEYTDTKRYLSQILRTAVEDTEFGDERVMELHGGIGDERRAEIQRAFNGDVSEFPVRILLATDAAREGINLQNHCADLFHFDVPWNPARMEQRNGRIDRTLQPEKEVRCHYFAYADRAEDAVLEKLVRKVETIQHELGSLGSVVMDRMSELLDARGIDQDTGPALDEVERSEDKVDGPLGLAERMNGVREELESLTREQKRLLREIEDAGKVLKRSRETMDFRASHLKDAIDVGLELSGLGCLEPLSDGGPEEAHTFTLPEAMPDSWARTLDSLRAPRSKDEMLWEWRRANPPLPVVFDPLERMSEDRVQLHLQHPFVKRLMARFLAQGFGTHDLSRVTVARSAEHSVPQVLAIGRVSLFGGGASRLHDELVVVSADWSPADGAGSPGKDSRGERHALHGLEEILRISPDAAKVPDKARARMLSHARADFDRLWPHIRDEADSVAHRAEQQLGERGAVESDALREILQGQRAAIEKELGNRQQLPLGLKDGRSDELRQFQDELEYMDNRLNRIEREVAEEPAQIEALYQVFKQRLTPIGLAYIWPEGMG